MATACEFLMVTNKDKGIEHGFVGISADDYYKEHIQKFESFLTRKKPSVNDVILHRVLSMSARNIKQILAKYLDTGEYDPILNDFFKILSRYNLGVLKLDKSDKRLARLEKKIIEARGSTKQVGESIFFQERSKWMVKGDNKLNRIGRVKIGSMNPIYRLFGKNKKSANDDYVSEFLALKIAKALGGNVPDNKIIIEKFKDGTEKIMIGTRFIENFRDLEDRLTAKNPKYPTLFENSSRKTNSANLFFGRSADGTKVNMLKETLVAFAFLNDRDAVGSRGQNVGLDKNNNLSIIDLGHAFSGRDNLGASFVPELGKIVKYKNYSIFDEVPLYDQLEQYHAIKCQILTNPNKSFALNLKAKLEEDPEVKKLPLKYRYILNKSIFAVQNRYFQMEKKFKNREKILSEKNGRDIIEACESLQFLTFKTKENPLISSGITLADRENYIDIQQDKKGNYVFKLDKKNRKYRNKMKKIFKTLQKEGDIIIKNNGSIIIKPENLDIFIECVKSKRQEQMKKSEQKAAHISLPLELYKIKEKIRTEKIEAEQGVIEDIPEGGNSILKATQKVQMVQRKRETLHVECLNQRAGL